MKVIEIDMKQTKTITLRISNDLNNEIEKIVRERGYSSKSDFIRLALDEFLMSYQKELEGLTHEAKSWSRNSKESDQLSNPNLVLIY